MNQGVKNYFCAPLLDLHRDDAEDFGFAPLQQAAQRRQRLPIIKAIRQQNKAEKTG